MKLAAQVAFVVHLASTSGFQQPQAVGKGFRDCRSAKPSFRLHSAVLDETVNNVVADNTSSDHKLHKSKSYMPTRFDRLKQTYKGVRFEPPSENIITFSYADFERAVQNTEYAFERNSVVTGVAVEYSSNGCLVDIGAKASAFLPQAEAALVMENSQSLPDVIPLDTTMEFQIISEEDENGQLIVSVKRLQYKKSWEKVITLSEQDAIIEAPVIAVNRGGAICLVEGLRAFLPGSHLTGQLPDENLVGQTLKLKFLEVNTETNKLVVSNRKAVIETQMEDLSRGDVVSGLVKALKPYGAFVEVGGMSGLLHISQISYDHISDLEKVLQPGMQIKCMIIDHDKVNGRIALATKTLEAEPGDMLKNPQLVFENAEINAEKYHARMEGERLDRERAARDIVEGLSESFKVLAGETTDPLADVSDSLDSLLS